MKALLGHDRSWAFLSVLFLSLGTLTVGVWARVYQLGFPERRIWDEVYFPVMARKYLEGSYQFDLHPPLGKFIMAIPIALFGDTFVAWRLTPLIFGLALLALGFFLGWTLFGERIGALLVGAFFAGETMLIVYSRVGIMDGFLVFFVLATFYAALRAENGRQALWTAVMLGLAISIKWAAFPVAIPAGYVLWRKGLLRSFVASLWVSAVLYLAIVYVERLIVVSANPIRAWEATWEWHLQAFDKVTAAIPNPWGSPWWSWPVMLRPIRFFYGQNAEGQLQVITAIGNPFLWWSSSVAVVAGVVEVARRLISRKPVADDPIVPILLGYVFLLLPWVPGTRIPYIYNYLPCYAFALLALVYWMCRIWRRPAWGPWAVVAFAVCALGMTLFFLPMVTGLPMSEQALLQRIWFDSWFWVNSQVM